MSENKNDSILNMSPSEFANYLAFFETFEPEIDDEQKATAWRPNTPEKANWLLQKLTEWQEQEQADERVAEEQILRAEMWLARQKEKRAGAIKWATAHLEWFARQQGKSTISLPYGKLTLRKPSWRLLLKEETGEDQYAILWCEKNKPELVKVKRSVDIAELKKLVVKPEIGDGEKPAVLVETGEEIPGLVVEIASEETFSVKLEGEKKNE